MLRLVGGGSVGRLGWWGDWAKSDALGILMYLLFDRVVSVGVVG